MAKILCPLRLIFFTMAELGSRLSLSVLFHLLLFTIVVSTEYQLIAMVKCLMLHVSKYVLRQESNETGTIFLFI